MTPNSETEVKEQARCAVLQSLDEINLPNKRATIT